MIGAAPVSFVSSAWVSSPGTFVAIRLPGLKPSLRLKGSGSSGTPAWLEGIESGLRLSWRPVVVEAGLVK